MQILCVSFLSMNTILTREFETIMQRFLSRYFYLDISQVGNKNTSVIITPNIWYKYCLEFPTLCQNVCEMV